MTLVHPDPDFVSLVLLQSFHLTFVKKKKMCTVSEYQQCPRLCAGHWDRTRHISQCLLF